MNGWMHGVFTVAALIGFLAVVVWAYSSKRRKDFDAAARLPLEKENE